MIRTIFVVRGQGEDVALPALADSADRPVARIRCQLQS